LRVALIGATGNVGSRILNELLSRGHQVTAIARKPEKLSAKQGLTLKSGSALNESELTDLLKGHDVVVSAYNAERGSPDYADTVRKAYRTIVAATKGAGVKRILIVGGAGSLEVSPGVPLLSTPQFPAEYKTEATVFGEVLDTIRKESSLEWTYFSPAAFLMPGNRTGHFRLGGNQLLMDSKGESKISMEDYAVAMADEIGKPAHIRQRFTAAY